MCRCELKVSALSQTFLDLKLYFIYLYKEIRLHFKRPTQCWIYIQIYIVIKNVLLYILSVKLFFLFLNSIRNIVTQ